MRHWRHRAAALLGLVLALVAAPAHAQAPAQALSRAQQLEDFDVMWRAIERDYAYFDGTGDEWRRARAEWRPRAGDARDRGELIAALEGAVAHLRDDHVSLSERTAQSPRRVPLDTDIWASWKGGAATVESIRTFGDADVAGLRPGQAITRIAGMPAERAVRQALGGAAGASAAARDWALRHVLAGPRSGTLDLEVREARGVRRLEIERSGAPPVAGPPLIGRRMGEDRDLGYIRIKTSLDDPGVAAQFDRALDQLQGTRALIVDLREVAGGSGHRATRAILGRFARVEAPWQVRERPGRPRATDRVAPRSPTYTAAVVVLVDRFTAGEGEALAAGLSAVAGARLIGTPMAGLRGELRATRLPHSGIVVRFPAERALHVDGTRRELLRPDIAVDLAAPDGGPGDPILYQALKLLERS